MLDFEADSFRTTERTTPQLDFATSSFRLTERISIEVEHRSRNDRPWERAIWPRAHGSAQPGLGATDKGAVKEFWEVTFSTVDRRPLARTEAERRDCVRALARCFGAAPEPALVAFCLRGDRLRLEVFGTSRAVGHRRAGLRRALGARIPRRLAAPDVRELGQRAHVVSVLRHYVAPAEGEGFGEPAALATGSCLPDLVGARCVTGLELATHRLLPRLGAADLWAMVGLGPVRPADDALVRAAGAAQIVSAASFALGAPPALEGLATEVVSARRVAVRLAADVGIPVSETAWALGIGERGVRRLSGQPVDHALLRAVRLRLAARGAVGRSLLAG